jgi:hypothetical protein
MKHLLLILSLISTATLIGGDFEKAPLTPTKKGSFYAKAATGNNLKTDGIFPGYGFGYRRSIGKHGLDISTNYASFKTDTDNQYEKFVFWTAPSISYIHYLTNNQDSSLYGGIGIGWGETYLVSNVDNNYEREYDFQGLMPNLMIGYEFLRNETFLTFLEFNVTHPMIASYRDGNMKPKPYGQVSLGAGF